MNDERDFELGAALRELHVPEHDPAFFDTLLARLEHDVIAPRRRRRGAPPLVLVGAAAAVVVVLVAATALLPTSSNPVLGPRVASATEVRHRVAQALAELRTLQGELTIESADGAARQTERWSVVTTADGRERSTGIGRVEDTTYDPATGEERSVHGDFNPPASDITGLPAGPPDFAVAPSLLSREYGSVVRVFLTGSDNAAVSEVKFDGRRAWHLVVPVEPNKLAGPGGSSDQLDITVDRDTGFPLQVRQSLAGRFVQAITLSHLIVNAPVDPAAFVVTFPPGTKVLRQDAGYRRVRLDQAAAIVGYQPILPRELPGGYQLVEVTVARQSQVTGVEGSNPDSRNVVNVAYRRGFDRIVVSTRTMVRPRSNWGDPLGTGEGEIDQPTAITVTSGALAGTAAEIVVNPRGIPHVWAINDRFVVTVGGDATRAELERMINSFG